jgi:mannose-6-phosphate isomerase-like protein (cupin superfamily)
MKVEKPWGWYEDLYRDPTLVLKRICVMPGQALSLQQHMKRGETWILPGTDGAIITLGKYEGSSPPCWHQFGSFGHTTVYVPVGMEHRVHNSGSEPFVFLEVQEGECSEDDIVRLADNYGRI